MTVRRNVLIQRFFSVVSLSVVIYSDDYLMHDTHIVNDGLMMFYRGNWRMGSQRVKELQQRRPQNRGTGRFVTPHTK